MPVFTSTDNVLITYFDSSTQPDSTKEDSHKPWLILIHGFTGSHRAFDRNFLRLSKVYRVIVPSLRGHGESGKPYLDDPKSATVERLAVDLRELIGKLAWTEGKSVENWRGRVMGGSLGCAVIWYYAHLYTTTSFTHTLFIDQAPLQNRIDGDWEPPYCHKGLQTASDLASFSKAMLENPTKAHLGTIHSCLGYISHPFPEEIISQEKQQERYNHDVEFFQTEALKGDPAFYVKLMTDHTALDHGENIKKSFGPGSGSVTKVLVVASSRSGCFEPEGVLSVVGFVNGDEMDEKKKFAKGVIVDWGGHWCYWEDPARFDELALGFFAE